MNNFNETHVKLTVELLGIRRKLKQIFIDLDSVWETDQLDFDQSPSFIAGHLFQVNKFIIEKVLSIKRFTENGIINTEFEQKESDLSLVEAIMNVAIHKIGTESRFNQNLPFSLPEMHMKINSQLSQFQRLLDDFPMELAGNFKAQPRYLTNIQLDVFQTIYFGILQTKLHLTKIQTQKMIAKTAQRFVVH